VHGAKCHFFATIGEELMSAKSAYSLREIAVHDLPLVLTWRNSPRIRELSYHDQIISSEQHEKWFQSLQSSGDKIGLIFEVDQKPVGVVQFFEISQSEKKCKWGFYLGEENLAQGTGSHMAELALAFAFEKFDVDKICGEAFSSNFVSQKFHEKVGFARDGVVERGLYRDGEWLDIHLFSITREQWRKKYARSAA
jgi:UDP-4-amino-4,6-dideoxy-N-acetyl-beta-L-altrosamine N-acetyltransferase